VGFSVRLGDAPGDPVVLTRSQIKRRWASSINSIVKAGIMVAEVQCAYELSGNENLGEAVEVFEDAIRSLYLAMEAFKINI